MYELLEFLFLIWCGLNLFGCFALYFSSNDYSKFLLMIVATMVISPLLYKILLQLIPLYQAIVISAGSVSVCLFWSFYEAGILGKSNR